jgi:hypothetical protein
MTLIVDAANVVGSRPDGWWRDRAGAAARLLGRLAAALRTGALDGPILVVLEGAARAGAPAGSPTDGLRVAQAERDGDSTIVAETTTLMAGGELVTVVTADRGLRALVLEAGGSVLGPSWLLDRLPPP